MVDMAVIVSAGALSMAGVGESGVVSDLGLGQGLEDNSQLRVNLLALP